MVAQLCGSMGITRHRGEILNVCPAPLSFHSIRFLEPSLRRQIRGSGLEGFGFSQPESTQAQESDGGKRRHLAAAVAESRFVLSTLCGGRSVQGTDPRATRLRGVVAVGSVSFLCAGLCVLLPPRVSSAVGAAEAHVCAGWCWREAVDADGAGPGLVNWYTYLGRSGSDRRATTTPLCGRLLSPRGCVGWGLRFWGHHELIRGFSFPSLGSITAPP